MEAQVALMARIAVHQRTEALPPGKPTAIVLFRLRADIGVDVPAIGAAQDKLAAERQGRMNERIAALEDKITTMIEKVAEAAS